MNATGIITATYLHTDIISDGNPFPSPSSAPAEVTDTVDTINPTLIILNAVHVLRRHCLHRNHGEDQLVQFIQIPLFLRNIRRNTGI